MASCLKNSLGCWERPGGGVSSRWRGAGSILWAQIAHVMGEDILETSAQRVLCDVDDAAGER